MAGHQFPPEEDLHPVFITTSLDTHFAVAARHTDTVADLKRMLIPEHLSSFPGFGEIRIDAIKVKRRGHFYRLQDAIPLRHIFKRKDYWYIYADASVSAVYLEEINVHDDPSSDGAPVIQIEGLNEGRGTEDGETAIGDDTMDAGSVDTASGSRKKLKLDETLKRHDQEDPVLHPRSGGSGAHSPEKTADFNSELIIKQLDNNDSSEKKAQEESPVQDQVLINAESIVQSGRKGGVDLAPLSHHGHPDGDEADGGAQKDDISHVSSATNLDHSMLTSKKRKKSSQKKESSKRKGVNSNGEHGLEQVDGSRGAIPEAKPKESAAMENSGKQITDNMAQVEEQVAPADVGDGSMVQKGLSLLLRESTELSGRDVADERSEKVDAIPDPLASAMLKNGSFRDKRKKSASKRDLSRKRTAVPTEELELKHVEISSGTLYLAKHNKPDYKEDVIEKITENTSVVHDQHAVANTDLQGGIQHGPELVLGEIIGQFNEKGVTVSATSIDDVGKNASAKKRKKSTQRKEYSKKKNIDANQENLPKHVDDLEVNEKSENVIQADKEALNIDAGDVSRVQNDLMQEENNRKFNGRESIRGATGVASLDPFIIGVMEDKSYAKSRKKSSHTKVSSKKKPLDPDEKHVQRKDPIDKHGSEKIEVPEDVSYVPEPEQDNTGKNTEENLDDMSVHDQVLGADANFGGEVQIGAELSMREENNGQIPGDGTISGTGNGHVANELVASGLVGGESSKKKTKKSTDKPSKKITVFPEEKLGQMQDAKKVLLMHVEDSVGANSSAETKEANNKDKIIKEKPADVVVVHEKTFDYNAGDGVLEENNELLHGDEANDESKRVNLAPDLLASGDMEDGLSKQKKKKSTTKPSTKKIDHTDEKLALKQYPKEKVVSMHVEDSAGIHEQTSDVDANGRVQEENNEQLHGDEANCEAQKVNLALDLLASCVMEVESSKKKTKKSMNKQNQKKALHIEKLALKQDPKEKVAPKYVNDSVGANTSAETKEADNEQKCKEDSANVVVAHEQTFDADAGERVQGGNNEQFDGAEANDEASKVNLALDLLASCVKEDESCKRKTKAATNKQNKKKTLQLEEKLTWKQDPKENVLPKQVKESVGANTSAETKEADNKEKSKENSADVVVHEQTFDADAFDRVLEENNEQFYGDEASVEVEKADLVSDLAVSGVVRVSPKKKKPTQTNNATAKKPIDLCEDREVENIECSPGGSSLARPGELVNSKNYFSVVEGNESVTPVGTDVDSPEFFKRKLVPVTAPKTQKKGKRKQTAANRSVEQEGDVSACNEISKKEMPKFVSTSAISKTNHLLSSASPVPISDGIHEDYGSINFSDYFTPTRPQVVVAASTDGIKGKVKTNPSNIRKSGDSEASPSAIEVTKNSEKSSHLDRYCVAFRNSSDQSLRKRSLLDKSGLIFKDESSDSSDGGQRSGMSDATTRTPADDTASSDYSDGDSNALKKSQGSGNGSQQNGRRSNMKSLLSTAGKDVELTKILQRSSRYKMVKKAASQSQEKDMDSERVDFVPDSQADV